MMKENPNEETTTKKEQILSKIRNAVIEKPEASFDDIDLHSDTWKPISEEDGNAITFVQKFKDLGGLFIYLECEDELQECLRQLGPQNHWDPIWCTSPTMQKTLNFYGLGYSQEPIRNDNNKLVYITDCDYLVAQTGSIVFSDARTNSRRACCEADVLLVIARTGQIVCSLHDAFVDATPELTQRKDNQLLMLTGRTKTYDIEQNLVENVFGPRQIAVFLIDE